MMNAYLFPGQGAQFPGMGKDLYVGNPQAKILFEKANECLGFRITDVMFEGTKEELQQTQVTQPAVFIHSVILAKTTPHFQPAMVAGHSLGELSALVASQVLTFEAGLQLVAQRAKAMQAACELAPGAMAAILGLSDEKVAQVCASIDEFVVPANYNCPGQLAISGTHKGITLACEAMETAGGLGTILLPVGGAFHSLLMEPAKQQFARAISQTKFQRGICPIYQNVNATPTTAPELIQEHLMQQLTAPVRWTQTIRCMIQDGAQLFIECGPGKTLQGLVRKIDKHVQVASL
jgi:[acyl-carrier-protein] S-malonyltransferase